MPIDIDKREYNYLGILNIKKSKFLEKDSPRDDVVKWLFMETRGIHYSFIYKIIDEKQAAFDSDFEVSIDFFRFELVKKITLFNEPYKVFRGNEMIGEIKLLKFIGNCG